MRAGVSRKKIKRSWLPRFSLTVQEFYTLPVQARRKDRFDWRTAVLVLMEKLGKKFGNWEEVICDLEEKRARSNGFDQKSGGWLSFRASLTRSSPIRWVSVSVAAASSRKKFSWEENG
ncbi:hypothetical protein [Candidatus Methylacidithermus pantelleriae]|uniref:Uncharacterized protein n=1 Tax=Candidatus Methylacidithermus pantelleriae TaxID=2744239 RepID=A0A8J2BQK5_9BACT|nr:hypothetical protein [Candidatus Methylacidithermus pantelleriae]CAF0702257.1 hypothetical protein MPNT_50014 [Candidatus Methylacidithermus pantelleriae]